MSVNSSHDDCTYDGFLKSLIAGGPNVCEFYGKYREKYDAAISDLGWEQKDLFAEAFAAIQPNRQAKILDVGCGTGLFGQALLRKGYANIDGLDGSRAFFEVALKKGIPYRNFVELRLTEDATIPIGSDTYDAILLSDVVYKDHISVKSFENLIRLLKPGGVLGWANAICFKQPWDYYNPEPEEYETLVSLEKRKLIRPVANCYPKVVKHVPGSLEQQVWFATVTKSSSDNSSTSGLGDLITPVNAFSKHSLFHQVQYPSAVALK